MIKRMGLFQRRKDLTQTQFSAYWAKKHSPLVLNMPRFIRYIQNHRLDVLPNFTTNHLAFDLDGIAEMYWHSEAEMQTDFNSQQGIDILRQDETEFMSNISVCIVNETVLQGSQDAIKIVMCLSEAVNDEQVASIQSTLPNLKGLQISTVERVIQRPQLPAIAHIPQQFISLWFHAYEQLQTDFQSREWKKFYEVHFNKVQRLSFITVNPLIIRDQEST